MLAAAMVIREEKQRMADALNAATSRERAKLMRTALRRVRRLNHDMKNLMVANDLKQKHSVLLYSLRMLEARLLTECPDAKYDMEEGPLEQTPEHHQQLYEARQNFEEELANDIAGLHMSSSARADRAAARQASEFRRSMQDELAEVISSARGSLEAAGEASHLVAFAKEMLTPFAGAEECLGVEAFRQAEMERGPQEASGFGPRRKYLEEAINKTSTELKGLEKTLHTVAFSHESRNVDRELEHAIARVEKRWTAFCEAYPLLSEAVLGSETPRSIAEGDISGEGLRTAKASATLMFDDLDLPGEKEDGADGMSPRSQPHSPAAEQAVKSKSSNSKKPGNRKQHESRGRKGDAKDSPTKALPRRPPARPPPKAALDASAKSLGIRKSSASADQVETNPSRGQRASERASGDDANALLARLDALTKTMDTTLNQAGSFSRPSAKCPSKAPLPSRKPAVPPARGRSGAA